MRSTLAFTLALVAGLVGVTAIASAMTSSNPSTPPPTRGKATDTHPRLKKSFRVLRRERRADDALTADGEQMLEAASELGTNAKLARRAKKTDDGQTYYLVPGTDSIALVNQHGVGSIDDMDHALSGQNVGIQDCA